MAIEQLLAALETDARAQVERLRADARTAADRVAEEAASDAKRRRGELLAARAVELRAGVEVALGEARRAARKAELEARERLLDRVFAAARGKLASAIAADVYRAALPRQLADALASVGDAPAEVRCAPALVGDLRRQADGRPYLTITADPGCGAGFTLETADGAIAVDGTLEERLGRERQRLAIDLWRELQQSP